MGCNTGPKCDSRDFLLPSTPSTLLGVGTDGGRLLAAEAFYNNSRVRPSGSHPSSQERLGCPEGAGSQAG